MIDIASQSQIDQESLFQYIIEGIGDSDANKAVLYGATSIKEFRSKLRIYEGMRTNTKKREDKTSDAEVKKSSSKIPNTRTTTKDGVPKKRNCYSCGSSSHVVGNCPDRQKGPKCFKCNEFGHISKACPASSCSVGRDRDRPRDSLPNLDVVISGTKLRALVDSGSELTLIQCSAYKKLGEPCLGSKVDLRGLGPNRLSTQGSFSSSIHIQDCIYDIHIHVVPDEMMKHKLILGRDFLQQVNMVIKEGKIVNLTKIEPPADWLPEMGNIDSECFLGDQIVDSEVEELVGNYRPCKEKDPGVSMRIFLTDDLPVFQGPRRLSPPEKDLVDSQIDQWLTDNIIQPSSSDYASPIVLVRKKNGETRVCVDYRKLNSKVVKERFPLPLIDDQIDALQGARVFSTLDLKNGFLHVPIDEESRKYTSFVTPSGQYEFRRVPFGLCNSPAVFQRYINAIFRDLIAEGVLLIYMDDIIIPSRDRKEGLSKLKKVLERAAQYGLQINWKKCQFLKSKIEFLGHLIQDGRVGPSPQKTLAVKNFPRPLNFKSLQSFLGLTGYFRKFIANYALIARPLSDLLKKDAPYVFGQDQEQAFQQLKMSLSDSPVLKLYEWGADTELHTDASKHGYGAILLQKDENDNQFHPVYYASGKTSPAEERYISYELEVLAIVKALRKFRVYLLGIRFRIVTDCQAFQMTLNKKDLSVRVARWVLLLEEFQFEVVHRQGTRMRHVDSLSRYPVSDALYVEEEQPGFLEKIKKAQEDDEGIKNIVNNPVREQGFLVQRGVLLKECNNDILFVVPDRMQTEIIQQAHRKGHFSTDKTTQLLRKDYYFPQMKTKVEREIRNCVPCILAERKQGKREGFLHCLDKGVEPLDTYHLDHIGPLPSTKKTYKHILVVVDAFTKFAWLYPTKSTGTTEVLDRLKKQAAIFGNPRRIITDRGTAFTSSDFKEYCDAEKIQHTAVTTGVPRGNGQVERLNRVLIPLLTKLTHPNPEKWWTKVDKAQQFINSTSNRSTGASPSQLLLGKNLRLTEDSELRDLIQEAVLVDFQDERDALRIQARENIARIQAENRRTFNKNRKTARTYKVGDWVAIRRTQPGTKLQTKFVGPYRITRILQNERYHVQRIGAGEGPGNTTTVAEYMKPWPQNTRKSDPVVNETQDLDNFNGREVNSDDSQEEDDGPISSRTRNRQDGRTVGSDNRHFI